MNKITNKPQTIGSIAKQAGVGVDTVRFYERKGLLPEPQRTAAGYRLYSNDTIDRLSFIRRAKNLGFSLEEISILLNLQDNGGAKADVKAITNRKLTQINSKIDDLTRMRDVLQTLNADCSGSGDICNCPIIEALTHEETT